jgi:hypothetical protein
METDMVGKYLDPGCAQGVGHARFPEQRRLRQAGVPDPGALENIGNRFAQPRFGDAHAAAVDCLQVLLESTV